MILALATFGKNVQLHPPGVTASGVIDGPSTTQTAFKSLRKAIFPMTHDGVTGTRFSLWLFTIENTFIVAKYLISGGFWPSHFY